MWILLDGQDQNGNAYWYGVVVFLNLMCICFMFIFMKLYYEISVLKHRRASVDVFHIFIKI